LPTIRIPGFRSFRSCRAEAAHTLSVNGKIRAPFTLPALLLSTPYCPSSLLSLLSSPSSPFSPSSPLLPLLSFLSLLSLSLLAPDPTHLSVRRTAHASSNQRDQKNTHHPYTSQHKVTSRYPIYSSFLPPPSQTGLVGSGHLLRLVVLGGGGFSEFGHGLGLLQT
jgi:hypothetical protein